MKKVLYIGGFCMPDGNAAAQRVLGVAKALRECKCEVLFCGLHRNNSRVKYEGIYEGFHYINYPYPNSMLSWLKYLTGRDTFIEKIDTYNPDTVILYNHPALATEYIYRYCKKKGIRVIGDITEWYEPHGNIIFRAIKGFDIKRRMNTSNVKLDGLICISHSLSNFYKDKVRDIVEIPPLVDINQAKWHQLVNCDTDEIRIVYAGSPGIQKDRLDLVLQSMDKIIPLINNKIRFDIIGITQIQYQRFSNDYTERSYVFFNGRKPHDEVIKKLLNADFQIFLRPDNLPNRAGFPTKFAETITSRTLPITNLSSNLSQYLSDGINGFIIPSIDAGNIEQTLLKALSITRAELDKKKSRMLTEIFDYRSYISEIIGII